MHTTTLKAKCNNLHAFVVSFFLLISYLSSSQVGINTITPNSTLEVDGSVGQKITNITETTTLDATHNTIICNNAVGITINLPSVSNPDCAGRIYTIKKGSLSLSTAAVSIDGFESQTIDGVETFLLSDDQGTVIIANDGTEWKVISKHLSPYPVGEVSYFKITGTLITLPLKANANTGADMVACKVVTPATADPATNKLQSKPVNEFSTDGLGRLIYNGKTTRTFHIACTISATSPNNEDIYVFGVGLNGAVIPSSKVLQTMGGPNDTQSTAMHVVAVLATGNYLELMAGNISNAGQNISINSLCLFALGM